MTEETRNWAYLVSIGWCNEHNKRGKVRSSQKFQCLCIRENAFQFRITCQLLFTSIDQDPDVQVIIRLLAKTIRCQWERSFIFFINVMTCNKSQIKTTWGSTSSSAVLPCSWIFLMVSILVPYIFPWKLPYSRSSFCTIHLVIASLEMKKYSFPFSSSFFWGRVVSVYKKDSKRQICSPKTL